MTILRARFPHDKPASALAEYAAFRVVDRRQLSVSLLPAVGSHYWVKYSGLVRSEQMQPDGSPLLLFFTSLAVSIEGRNLGEIAEAIAKERCAFVAQFDPARHTRPEDPHVPFVSHLTIYAPEPPLGLLSSKHPASEPA